MPARGAPGGYAAIRVGKAQVPGPGEEAGQPAPSDVGGIFPVRGQVRLLTANITALTTSFDLATALSCDVAGLQEVRLCQAGQARYKKLLAEKGWQVAWGKPQL